MIVHFAFEVDQSAWVLKVASLLGRSDADDGDAALRVETQRTIRGPVSAAGKSFLQAIAAPDAPSEVNELVTADYFEILMAEFVQFAPTIRDPGLLERALSTMGWGDRATRLTNGDALAEIAIPPVPPWVREIIRESGWATTGGFLGAEHRGELLEDLRADASFFAEPTADFVRSERVSTGVREDTIRALLYSCYRDAVTLLSVSADSGLLLFTIW